MPSAVCCACSTPACCTAAPSRPTASSASPAGGPDVRVYPPATKPCSRSPRSSTSSRSRRSRGCGGVAVEDPVPDLAAAGVVLLLGGRGRAEAGVGGHGEVLGILVGLEAARLLDLHVLGRGQVIACAARVQTGQVLGPRVGLAVAA